MLHAFVGSAVSTHSGTACSSLPACAGSSTSSGGGAATVSPLNRVECLALSSKEREIGGLPSAHLSQAKRNHRQQSKWLKNHMTRCKANDDSRLQLPPTSSSSKWGLAAVQATSKEQRTKSSGGKQSSDLCNLEGAVGHWACDLRFYNDQLLEEVRKEQQCFHRRRDDALSKLKMSQRKWRQKHVEWEQKQKQPLRETRLSSKSMSLTMRSIEDPEIPEINLPDSYDRNIAGDSPSLCSESSTDGDSSPTISHPRSSLARSSASSINPQNSTVTDSYSEHLAVLAADMQGKKRMSLSEELSSEESEVPRRQSLEVPKALLRRQSSLRRGSSGGTNPIHPIEEKDDHDPELDKPLVLEGDIDLTGESHERERRRSIAQAAGGENTWNILPADKDVVKRVRIDPTKFTQTAHQRWEEWRRDFPLDTLNQLAHAFESWHLENGHRITSLGMVEDVVHVSMGWSPRVVRNIVEATGLIPENPDMTSRVRRSSALLLDADVQQTMSEIDEDEVVDQLRDHPLNFGKVTDLLDFIRSALELAEREEPEVLWSEVDYQSLVAVFKLASSSHNSLPVKNLIGAINALDFEELRLETALEQQRLANITKLIIANRLARRQQQGKNSQEKDGSLKGAIGFRDFARVASMSLRDAERTNRMKEFGEERNAVKDSGFGLLEVEDMRELHEAFCKLVQPNASGQRRSALDGILRLLRGCNIRGFKANEVDRLQGIVQTDGDFPADGSEITFSAFVSWMDTIAEEGLADLTREGQTCIALEDLADRGGFAAAMLREQIRESPPLPSRRSSRGVLFSSQL